MRDESVIGISDSNSALSGATGTSVSQRCKNLLATWQDEIDREDDDEYWAKKLGLNSLGREATRSIDNAARESREDVELNRPSSSERLLEGDQNNKPTLAEPAFAEPAFSEPAFSEPAFVEPTVAQPSFTEPTFVEPKEDILDTGSIPSDPWAPEEELIPSKKDDTAHNEPVAERASENSSTTDEQPDNVPETEIVADHFKPKKRKLLKSLMKSLKRREKPNGRGNETSSDEDREPDSTELLEQNASEVPREEAERDSEQSTGLDPQRKSEIPRISDASEESASHVPSSKPDASKIDAARTTEFEHSNSAPANQDGQDVVRHDTSARDTLSKEGDSSDEEDSLSQKSDVGVVGRLIEDSPSKDSVKIGGAASRDQDFEEARNDAELEESNRLIFDKFAHVRNVIASWRAENRGLGEGTASASASAMGVELETAASAVSQGLSDDLEGSHRSSSRGKRSKRGLPEGPDAAAIEDPWLHYPPVLSRRRSDTSSVRNESDDQESSQVADVQETVKSSQKEAPISETLTENLPTDGPPTGPDGELGNAEGNKDGTGQGQLKTSDSKKNRLSDIVKLPKPKKTASLVVPADRMTKKERKELKKLYKKAKKEKKREKKRVKRELKARLQKYKIPEATTLEQTETENRDEDVWVEKSEVLAERLKAGDDDTLDKSHRSDDSKSRRSEEASLLSGYSSTTGRSRYTEFSDTTGRTPFTEFSETTGRTRSTDFSESTNTSVSGIPDIKTRRSELTTSSTLTRKTGSKKQDELADKALSWSASVEDKKRRSAPAAKPEDVQAVIWWSTSKDAVEVLYEDDEDDKSADSETRSSQGSTHESFVTNGSDNTFTSELQIDFSFSTIKEVTGVLVEEATIMKQEMADASRDMLRPSNFMETAKEVGEAVAEGPKMIRKWLSLGGSSSRKKGKNKGKKKGRRAQRARR